MINSLAGAADDWLVTANVAASSPLASAVLWLLPVFLIVGMAFRGYLWWRRNRQTSQIREWALARGFRAWSTRGDLALHYAGGPFGSGRQRSCIDVIEGTYGDVPVRLFTYRYVTGTGRDKKTVHHRVASAQLQLWVPSLELSTENILTRAWGAVRGDDLDLESHDFNQAYRVQAADRAVAVALLHPVAMEHLLAHRHRSWWYEQGDVLFADRGEWRAADLDFAVSDVVGMARLVPRHIRRDYGVDTAGGVR